MKRSIDKIRYLILKVLSNGNKINLERIRKEVNTGLPTILLNVKNMEKMGFVNVYQQNIGKRTYTEVNITSDGKLFLKKVAKIIEEDIKQ